MNLILHTLRLLINVTNGYEPCCDRLAESETIATLTQNIIQFYGQCRNFNPGQEDAQVQQGSNNSHSRERIHWTTQPSSDSSGSDPGPPASMSVRDMEQDQCDSCSEGGHSSNLDAAEIQNDANGWYDILLLSIGLLINILEVNSRHREQVTERGMVLIFKYPHVHFHGLLRCAGG